MNEISIAIKKSISNDGTSYSSSPDLIKEKAKELLDLLVNKTPKNTQEDNLITLLSSYIEEVKET